ncbi:MAG: hypothetical protein ACRC0G_07880 [Fusobacteriaceae bacterium]
MMNPDQAATQAEAAFLGKSASPNNSNGALVLRNPPGSVMGEKVIYHTSTKNYSFLKMAKILKTLGITNCMFHLKVYDPRVMRIDPRSSNLNVMEQAIVLREVMRNYYYYIREIILIPESGGLISYKLHRGNLALTYCLVNNLNAYQELPRQHGKTIGACAFYSWVYQFATEYSEIMYMNKKHDDSKLNLKRTKDMLENLPEYIRFKDIYDPETGKKKKGSDNREFMENAKNHNRIVTKPAATSPENADGLGRGCTQPCQWYDEFGYVRHNSIIFAAATPAQVTAAIAAASKNKPNSRLITTTPGDLTTEYGAYAKYYRDMSCEFMEEFYDWNVSDVKEYIRNNSKNNVVFIKFTYQELGKDIQWFEAMCKDLANNWEKIRREVLLEWIIDTTKSPFAMDDLEEIKSMIEKDAKIHPKKKITLNKFYTVELYNELELDSPMILSCDVSGGYSRDASSMVLISSKTTKILGVFRSSTIGIRPFSDLIYSFVSKYAPNAVVCIERNSYGEGVISNLRATSIAKNLYYEFKKDATVSRVKNGFSIPENRTVKTFGVWTDSNTRPMMMDILRDRVEHHKDKFVSPIIYEELQNLEYKNNRVDHKSGAHDDTVMGWLIGLYVYTHGNNLAMFGVRRTHIPTDKSITEDAITEVFDNLDEEAELKYLASMRNLTIPAFEKPIRDYMANHTAKEDFNTKATPFTDASRAAFDGISVKKSLMNLVAEIDEERARARHSLSRDIDVNDPFNTDSISMNFFEDMNDPDKTFGSLNDMDKYI